MADKAISELIVAEQITPTDMFVLEQNGTAKKLTGQVLLNWLTAAADGHGGIQSIVKISTSGFVDTYRITMADTTYFDFQVTNGRAITSVKQTSVSGLTRTYTINFNDGGTETFTVTDGRAITEIVKTSTRGLVDTYTISLNDGTSKTFTVTNGAKGDKGDNQYVWIKYASQKPTASSHSFGDMADNWIGIYSGDSATAPTDWTQYEWFQIKGEKGDTGEPATLVSSEVRYQASDSGTIIPSGAWSSSVPVVPQGKYLWTRTTNTFNSESPVVSYSVTRMGLDGSGSVSSVANISPDEHGNVPLTASDVGALPNTGGDLNGELKMNGRPISGLNAPTANDQAANMGFVNQQVRKAAPRNLLDNSDFRNPVNQRGFSEAYDDCFCIDRWKMAASTGQGDVLAVRLLDGCLQLNAVKGELDLEQNIPNHDSLVGKRCTVAVNLEGTVYCGAFSFGHQAGPLYFGDTKLKFYSVAGQSAIFRITSDVDVRYNLYWVAIYEGEYTINTLPEYQPKGYGAELFECMRYYQQSFTNNPQNPANLQIVFGANDNWLSTVKFPVPMRVPPEVILYNNVTGNEDEVCIWKNNEPVSDVYANAVGTDGFNPYKVGGIVENLAYGLHYIADAEL